MKEFLRQWQVFIKQAQGDPTTFPVKQARAVLAEFLLCLRDTQYTLNDFVFDKPEQQMDIENTLYEPGFSEAHLKAAAKDFNERARQVIQPETVPEDFFKDDGGPVNPDDELIKEPVKKVVRRTRRVGKKKVK